MGIKHFEIILNILILFCIYLLYLGFCFKFTRFNKLSNKHIIFNYKNK